MKPLLAAVFLAASAVAQVAITNVSVIPMDSNQVLRNQTVVTNGDKIVAIGPSKSTRPPQGGRVINGRGKYLIPGLTDAHVHLLSPDQFPLYVANGVTTVFNLEGRPAHLEWRKQVAEGKLLGPTIFTSGPIFFGSRTAETGVKFVDQQADAGYDAFKIISQGPAETYAPVAAEVKKRGMLFIGHIPRAVGAEAALEAGQSIAHADEFLYTYFNPKRSEDEQHLNVHHIVADEARIPELARRVRESAVIVEPTLVTYRDGIEEATNLDHFLATKPELKYLAPWVLDTISPAKNRFKAVYKEPEYPVIRAMYPFQQKLVRALHDAGVPLLAGTDATDSGPVAGFGLHDELEELVKCGLSNYEALKTATVNPATYLRHANDFGTIESGKRADLLLLNANPLDKIGNTRQIAGVMLHGKWIDAAQAKSMLEALPATYAKEHEAFVRDLEQDPKRAAEWAQQNDPFHGMQAFVFAELMEQRGTEGFLSLLGSIKKKDADSPFTSEAAVNQLGYQLIETKPAAAIRIFELNTELYPNSANTYDSLGEAQFKTGDATRAVASYRHALKIDPKYANAECARKFVAEHEEVEPSPAK